MAITILRIRGHAIRHNIHCTDPDTLIPILEIHDQQTIQLAFSVRFAGSCTIHYVPDNNPDVWIETADTLDILAAPLLPPRHHQWCISTHTGHHRSNRKRIRKQLALPLLPVLAVRKGRSGKATHTNHVRVLQASDLIYADPTQGARKLSCGAYCAV
jgi:hypothetical protein